MFDLGHPKVKLEVEFRSQSFFPVILIFGTIFPPTFKILTWKGQNFGISTPMNKAIFPKIPNMEFWMLHLRHLSLGDQNDLGLILKENKCSLRPYAHFFKFWPRSPMPYAPSQFWASKLEMSPNCTWVLSTSKPYYLRYFSLRFCSLVYLRE